MKYSSVTSKAAGVVLASTLAFCAVPSVAMATQVQTQYGSIPCYMSPETAALLSRINSTNTVQQVDPQVQALAEQTTKSVTVTNTDANIRVYNSETNEEIKDGDSVSGLVTPKYTNAKLVKMYYQAPGSSELKYISDYKIGNSVADEGFYKLVMYQDASSTKTITFNLVEKSNTVSTNPDATDNTVDTNSGSEATALSTSSSSGELFVGPNGVVTLPNGNGTVVVNKDGTLTYNIKDTNLITSEQLSWLHALEIAAAEDVDAVLSGQFEYNPNGSSSSSSSTTNSSSNTSTVSASTKNASDAAASGVSSQTTLDKTGDGGIFDAIAFAVTTIGGIVLGLIGFKFALKRENN